MQSKQKTNPIFEVIGVYFANCYWNNLYTSAMDIWSQESLESLDEAYRVAINRYNTAFCKRADKNERINSHYVKIVKDLHQNYKQHLQTSDTYFGFIDTVVKNFIPENYYKKLSTADDRKNSVFRDVLSKALTRFTLFVAQESTVHVVDADLRKDKNRAIECVTLWKKRFIEFLNQERNKFCSILMAKSSGADIKDPDGIPSIPKEICDKLQDKIKELIEEKEKMVKERNQYAKLARTYKGLLITQEETIKNLQQENAGPRHRTRFSSMAPQRRFTTPVIPVTAPIDALQTLENEEYSDDGMEPVDMLVTEPNFDVDESFGDEPDFVADD